MWQVCFLWDSVGVLTSEQNWRCRWIHLHSSCRRFICSTPFLRPVWNYHPHLRKDASKGQRSQGMATEGWLSPVWRAKAWGTNRRQGWTGDGSSRAEACLACGLCWALSHAWASAWRNSAAMDTQLPHRILRSRQAQLQLQREALGKRQRNHDRLQRGGGREKK